MGAALADRTARLPAARRALDGHRRAGAARAREARLQHALPPLPHALAPQALQVHRAPRLGRGELGGGAAFRDVRVGERECELLSHVARSELEREPG